MNQLPRLGQMPKALPDRGRYGRLWLATPGAVRLGDDELFFVTRSNAAEGTSFVTRIK